MGLGRAGASGAGHRAAAKGVRPGRAVSGWRGGSEGTAPLPAGSLPLLGSRRGLVPEGKVSVFPRAVLSSVPTTSAAVPLQAAVPGLLFFNPWL